MVEIPDSEYQKLQARLKELESAVAERKQAEEDLKESAEKYRSLVENIPDVIWTTDINGKTIFISSNVKEMYGFTPDEIYKGGDEVWFGRIHPDDKEKVVNAFKLLFEKEVMYDIEYKLQRKDGEWLWLHDRSMKTYEKNGIKYADGVFSDITERKQAEDKIKESEEKYMNLVERANDGIVIAQDNVIKFSNSAFTKSLGYEVREVNGIGFDRLIPQENRQLLIERHKKRLAGEEIPSVYETKLLHKNGDKISVEVNASVIQYMGKTADLVIIRDITERKRAEQEREKLNKFMLDREERVIEIKEEVNKLLKESGQPPKYKA